MKLRDLFVEIGMDVDAEPLKRFDKGVTSLRSNLRLLTTGLLGATGAAGGLLFLLKQAGGFEQTQIAFEVLLGSAKKATEVLKELSEFALKTPFQIGELENTAKLLLGMGFEAKGLTNTLNFLGNVSAGLDRPLKLLAWNLGQIKTQGKLTGRELRDFAGIPLLGEIAKIVGLSKKAVQEMVSRGEIGFDLVKQAFENMSSKGGKFFDLMIRQSKTLLGVYSNLKDFIEVMARSIGQELLPVAKNMANQLLRFLETNEKLIRQKGVKFFKEVGKTLWEIYKALRGLVVTIKAVTDSFGGMANALRLVMNLFLAWMALNILSAVGNLALGVLGLAKAFVTMGRVAALAQLKAVALPLAMGLAVAALILLIEDVISHFQGKDSLTGLLIDAFENKFPRAFKVATKAFEVFKEAIGLGKKGAREGFVFKGKMLDKPPAPEKESVFDRFIRDVRTAGARQQSLSGGKSQSLYQDFMTSTPVTRANINIQAPVNISVPEGVGAVETMDVIRDGVEGVLSEAIENAYKSVRPTKRF